MRKLLVVLCLGLSLSAMGQINVWLDLIARTTATMTMPDGYTGKIFGFVEGINDVTKIPSPTLYVTEGDSVAIDFWNFSQGAPHTIHLHGLDVDQQNDGVPSLSFVVEHQEHGYYYFKAPHPGLYLYHCHVLSSIHVQAGMYGMMVVLPASGNKVAWDGGPAYDLDFNFLFSEFDKEWHVDTIIHQYHNPGQIAQWAYLPTFDPEYFMVNGNTQPSDTATGETIQTQAKAQNLLRMANLGFYGIKLNFPASIDVEMISSDGRPIPAFNQGTSYTILPGERYGFLASSQIQLLDSIKVSYFDLNTMQTKGVKHIPFAAVGVIGLDEENGLEELKIYPNPASAYTQLRFVSKTDQQLSIKVFNLQAQLLGELHFDAVQGENLSTIDLAGLASGSYLVAIEDAAGNSSSVNFQID